MADNLETPDFGNFSIQSTMEGMGSQELLNDLLGPDTSTANPDDIQDINTPDPEPAAAPAAKKKAQAATSDDAEPADDKKDDAKKSITDFLYDEEEDEEDDAPAAPTPKADAAEDEDEESNDAPTTQFAALSNDLFKLGVFTKDEDEEDIAISTPEEFLERFENEKKKGAIDVVNNFIGQFGEDYQNAFQAI